MKKLAQRKLRCGYTIVVERDYDPDSYATFNVLVFTGSSSLEHEIEIEHRSDLKRAAEALMKAYERSAPVTKSKSK